MKTSELLQRLNALGVRLWVEGAELKVNAPKGALTPELKQELVRRKQGILDLLATARPQDEPPIPRWRDGAARPDELRPMSFTQKRVWFLDQLDPGMVAYNMWIALTLRGSLDVRAFESSVREVLRRHEVLRSSFPARDGVPGQRLHPPDWIELEVRERPAELSAVAWRERIRATLSERVGQPFDLARGPLFQPALFCVAADEHVFFARIHHIVFDGLSNAVLARELGQVYAAYVQGQPSPLPEPALQYHDYAAWQAQRFDGEHLERELAWWRRTLAGPLSVLELPADRPRPKIQTHVGANHTHRLEARLSAELDAFARREGTTVFAVMLAAYDALLVRLTGQTDVLVGTAAANRGRAELQSLVGYFVNTLVVRTDASGDPPFRELVSRAEQGFLGAMEHQEIPFERLVDDLSPERSLSTSPLFQTLFVLNQDTGEERSLGSLEVIPYTLEIPMSRTDLVTTVYRGREGTFVDLEYNTDLFDRSTIARFGRCYERLLADALRDPRRRLSTLEILDPEERERVLEGWNRTRSDVHLETLHGLFEASADACPAAPALCIPAEEGAEQDERWSYAELEAYANRIAHHLRARGVRPGELVGLCCERSADLVAALLAIEKCGAAYVPLDPGFPRERLVYMAEDARLRHVVTQAALRVLLPADLDAILLDGERDAIAARPAGRPARSATLDDRAYVIYTSGSTGRPKGVELLHRGVANFLASMRREPGMRPGETLLALTTLSFDISVLELFLPLSAGGCVALAAREIAADGDRLRAVLERLRPEIVQATPATWRMLLLAGWRGAPELRVLCGGEALSRELADELCERSGELWNLYGPTETTIWSTLQRIERDGRPITIGRPIANTRVYVLDAARTPVPPGTSGELWIAGAGLARSYLGRPRLTAERFVPDPFQPGTGERMYLTGDLARWRATAEGGAVLECLGRSDSQVKLRGFRIELGEVETTLGAAPGVHDCAVIVREDRPGDARLVAYWVAEDAQAFEPSRELFEAHLARSLPSYMVPAAFVRLEALPLTPNGKVDRRALRALQAVAAERQAEYVAPRDATEERLCAIFAAVLGAQSVGVHDSFFELGGNSLSTTQAMARVRQSFDVELPLRALFEEPTVAGLARRVRDARPRVLAAIPRADRSRALRLSFQQERLWFLDQLEPGLTAYNMWPACTLHGSLDDGALERALEEIVRRHEVLRTRFEPTSDGPLQMIEARAARLERWEDRGAPTADERRARLRTWLAERVREPFDLRHGPLFRPLLAQIADDEHVLVLLAHHSVFDGSSVGVFWRELAALYPAFAAGAPSPLVEPALQYADFAAWQRASLAGEAWTKLLSYWKETLKGELAVLELPADRPRPRVQTYAGATCSRAFSAESVARLGELARGEGATLFMGLLAVYDALLWRITGQHDLCVGTAVAGRERGELEPLIGFFVNTLVVRTDTGGNPSFRELLRRVRASALGAYEHQDMPFERLVEELAPERSLSTTPLFQTLLVLDQDTGEARRMGSLALEPLAIETKVARTDLTLWAYDGRDGFSLAAEYNTDLFDAATIDRLLARFELLLQAALAAPELPIGSLTILDPEERERVLEGWNRTRSDVHLETLHGLFEASADACPAAPALCIPAEEGAEQDERWSYAELEAYANRIAHHLRARGVRPGELVGLCCERSADLVAALLAIEKCGAAYVPLDPGFPRERLVYMAEDARLRHVVTQAALRVLLPADLDAILLDGERDAIAARPAGRPARSATLDDRAYVIYTSGSTGRPKGVELLHRGVANFLASMRREPGMRPGETLLALTTLSFDISVLELFLPLSAGGCVALAAREIAADGDRLRAVLERLRPEIVQATPATWRMLLLAGWRGAPELRVLCGGEALSRELADELCERSGELWNLYGPTETTIWSTLQRIERDGRPITIGQPIANTRVYVLDAARAPVPPGVTGELWIAGAGLARGYLGRPRLTAERFVPDPFQPGTGERMYLTGDLARWRPTAHGEATLECLGRSDGQVKLRGYRIELGEVEAALGAAPGVHDCAVILREDRPGAAQLVAYWVTEGFDEPARELFEAHLARSLPSYMVPAAFVRLEALPLTPNGKVDRRALRALQAVAAERQAEYVAPRDATEERLCAIFAAVLGAQSVGVHDSFFELGGNSLSTTQAMARVRQSFDVELPLRALFEEPTVAGLARRVRDARPRVLAAIPRADRSRALRLSFQQERLWFLDQLEPGLTAYNMWPACTLHGSLDDGALERALEEIVRRHEVLRTRFEPTSDGPLQMIEARAARLERWEDRGAPTADERRARLRTWLAERVREPFDLRHGPLFRPLLAQIVDDEHVLVLLAHHSVFDGSSVGVFWRELAALYPAFAAGAPSPLVEPALQYADFAAWQRASLAGEAWTKLLSYWKETLKGELAVLELPADRPRPRVQTYAGATCSRAFSAESVARLGELARGEGATLFMGLLAVYDALLWRITGQHDLCVGTAVAGRERGELEPLIGFFVNTLVVRTDTGGNPSFRELLRRVRASALGAYEHQDMPFERLVEELAPERSLSTTPLFQTLLVLDQDTGEARRMGSLALEPLAIETKVARTDLTLWAYDGRDGFSLAAEYNTDLFDAATIDRLLARFELLLQAALAAPELPIGSLTILDPEERQLLESWNDTASRYPREATIPALFEARVRAAPAAVAAVFVPPEGSGEEPTTITYADLNAHANRLAHRLRELGVGRDVLVGLCTERSLPMLVGILGILKAGGAYVPLDPGYPAERLSFMIEDASLSVILVQERFAQTCPRFAGTLVSLDDARSLAGYGDADPAPCSGPDDLAYVMFTSGSTGRPKGVCVAQRSVLRLVCDPNYCRLGPDEVILHFAPISFDASTFEVWGALLHGGRMIVYPPTAPALDELGRVLREQRVTTAWLTAGLFSLMVDQELDSLRGLRQLLAGGDVLPVAQVNRVLREIPGQRLINGYGPTENTTFTCCHGISDHGPVSGSVPIGKPISDTRVHVVDARGELVPIGVPGELVIAGDGLARGYLRRPELDRERFVPDPHRPGARLYRTGDIARWLPDGTLEFLGRRDDQVKVRGYRIELGEIESALGALAGVRECAAMVREDRPGDKRIVAYLVAEPATELDLARLRRELARKLPGYMLPAHLVVLEALPLSPNGKVDRKALPPPDAGRAELEPGHVAPRDEVEARIAAIWSEVLGRAVIGVRDNFFALGGNSLLTTKAMAAVRAAFDVDLPLRELFEEPTVAGLAARVRGDGQSEILRRQYEETFDASLIPLQPRGRMVPLFLVSGAHADEDAFLRFVGALLPHMSLEQPIYGFKARGLDGHREPHASAEEMAADYIREMREHSPQGPYLLAGNCVGGIVAFEMARQLRSAGQDVALVVLLDTVRPQEDYRAFVDHHFRFWKKERFLGHLRALGALDPKERVDYFWTRAKRKLRRALPLTEVQRRRNNVESVEREYSRILARYEPKPYEGEVTVVLNEELHSSMPSAGWQGFAREVATHVVPGDHVTRLSINAGAVARILRACIERALRDRRRTA